MLNPCEALGLSPFSELGAGTEIEPWGWGRRSPVLVALAQVRVRRRIEPKSVWSHSHTALRLLMEWVV